MATIVRIFLVFILMLSSVQSQEVRYSDIPSQLQLFPRDSVDQCEIVVAGQVRPAGYDSVIVEILREDVEVPWARYAEEIVYSGNSGTFSVITTIPAELAEYYYKIYVDSQLVAERDSIVCGDIYLINGQSNARATDYEEQANAQTEWFRSFGSSSTTPIGNKGIYAVAPRSSATDTTWRLAQGHTVHTEAAVGVWGLRLGISLVKKHGIPICVINGAVGATAIEEHLRNSTNPTDLFTIYGRLLYRAKQANVQNIVKAIFWHQGERNTDATYSDYPGNFDLLYSSWKQDYPSVEKIYVFQLHPGCNTNVFHSEMREIQRRLPGKYVDVNIMSTVGLPDHDGCHYGFDGYNAMADRILPLVNRDFYTGLDTTVITPANIKKAYFSSTARDEVVLQFDQPVSWPQDTLGRSMKDYFFLDGAWGVVDSGSVGSDGSTIHLMLNGFSNATKVTYLPPLYYHGTTEVYQGPWIRNPRGVGALSFHEIPIVADTTMLTKAPEIINRPSLSIFPNPFNPATTIQFTMHSPAHVKLTAFDIRGKKIEFLLSKNFSAGNVEYLWHPEDLASGIYLLQLTIGNSYPVHHKVLFLK